MAPRVDLWKGTVPRYTPLKEDLGFVPYSVIDPWVSADLRRRDTTLRELVGDTGELRDGSLRRKAIWLMTNTASVFSPVVAEILLKLWGPEPGGCVLDSFAGGGTRAIVSGLNGFRYHGIELRGSEAARVANVLSNLDLDGPTIMCGDACDPDSYPSEPSDMVLTCPPYFNLEKYGGGPRDLSSLPTYEDFLIAIHQVLLHTLTHVYAGSFAVWVVGNFLDTATDQYCDFRGDLIRLARASGWEIHDIAVLVGKLGTAGQRVANSWNRKRMVRRHEYAVVLRAPG